MDELTNIAAKIKSLEESRARLGSFLKDLKRSIKLHGSVLEEKLVYRVNQTRIGDVKIAAVDGGLSRHEYHGLDIILTRAVGVVYEYKEGKLVKVEYFPSALPKAEITIVSDPYSDEEFMISSSLERQKREIALAKRIIENFEPDILLLDGSIIPHGSDRPAYASAAWKSYKAVVEQFINLFKNANSLIVGCVEDSRARRFCEIVAEQILDKINDPRIPKLKKVLMGTRDTNLLYHVLEHGERTAVFRYSKKPSEHPVLKDFGQLAKRVVSFYIKTAEFDRPLRVDFLSNGKASLANEIANVLLSITPHNSYGCPAPLVEADVRAKLQESEADKLHDLLVDRVGITPSLMKLRREQRPF